MALDITRWKDRPQPRKTRYESPGVLARWKETLRHSWRQGPPISFLDGCHGRRNENHRRYRQRLRAAVRLQSGISPERCARRYLRHLLHWYVQVESLVSRRFQAV